MCGITGLIDPQLDRTNVRRALQTMTDAMIHRGPDDEGFFAEDGVGIGMRRLSIIDVAGGQQPIASEDGQVQVVFNGEIYNYLAVRAALERAGHSFATNADTEVIVHLYEDRGAAVFEELRGMFGVALWDRQARRLLLARDRLGEKPLFYAWHQGRLLFGSEIKAILAVAPELAEPNPDALAAYLQYGFVPEPQTMFHGIHKLPAAHYLSYQDGRIAVAPYWRLSFAAPPYARRPYRQWIEELDALLEEAVRIRLMSEVPLGVFLSGGLDSSTIVAYAHRCGMRPLKTFTIGFDRPEWDESSDAALVARHFGTEHHVLRLREEDLARRLPETVLDLVQHFDEPFGDSSAIPTYHVSRLAREHVTVILSGDGGDELFAGYSTYLGVRFAERYRRLPPWLGQGMLPALAHVGAELLPDGRRRHQAQRAVRVLRDSAMPLETMYFSKLTLCRPEILKAILQPELFADVQGRNGGVHPADIDAVMRSPLPDLSKASYADLRFRLLEDMLVKVDRMSMAHSLEVRPPLLDHRLVEFVAQMPPELKLRGTQTKAILRDTIRPLLPPETLRKRKQGFSIPLADWLRTSLDEMVGDYLGANGRLPGEQFDQRAVAALLNEHRSGKADHAHVIWVLLNYAVWYDLYLQGVSR